MIIPVDTQSGGTAQIANKGYKNVIGIVTGINNVNDKVRKHPESFGSSASGGFQRLSILL